MLCTKKRCLDNPGVLNSYTHTPIKTKQVVQLEKDCFHINNWIDSVKQD